MKYDIYITSAAQKDIADAADYIEYTLKNPAAAEQLLDHVTIKIKDLEIFPEKYTTVNDPVLASWGIHFITIDHYIAFYTIREHSVYIIRFLYQKRDWQKILSGERTE